MVTHVDHLGQLNDPGPTPKVFEEFEPLETFRNPAKGFEDWDDFTVASFSATAAATTWRHALTGAGVANLSTNAAGFGGVMEIGAGALVDTGGECWRNGNAFIARAGGIIIAEARLEFTVGSDVQFFFGLANEQAALFSGGENSSGNHIGFEIGATLAGASPGEIAFVTEAGTSRTSLITNPHTIVVGSFVKLGFIVTGNSQVDAYVNGVKKGTITTTIPTLSLTPHFAHLMEGTSSALARVDWMRIAQIATTSVTRET